MPRELEFDFSTPATTGTNPGSDSCAADDSSLVASAAPADHSRSAANAAAASKASRRADHALDPAGATSAPASLGPGSGGDGRDIYTPGRLNREARLLLERGLPSLWLEGEISNLSRPSSGHWYFSIKDESAQLRCAMFRQRNVAARFSPRNGMHVLARGRISLYEPRGDYQFIAEYIEEAGEGLLRQRFEALKNKLAAEGLFDAARKRPLPRLPRRIGIITSPTGAAVQDVLNILRRRFCSIPVLIYPVQVQGAAAAGQIATAIQLAASRAECDVLLLVRGGGSLEDLWAFNEEIVARAIAGCPLPLVSGIGHEVDFTIADFAADLRAPTPSGAAELVVPDSNEWLRHTEVLMQRAVAAAQRALSRRRERLTWLRRRLTQLHPGAGLRQHAQRLDELEQRLRRGMRTRLGERRAALRHLGAVLRQHSPAMHLAAARGRVETARIAVSAALRRRLQGCRARLEIAAHTLDAVSPLATLQRGYAIVSDSAGGLLTNTRGITPGTLIHARLAKGTLRARVEHTEEPAEHPSSPPEPPSSGTAGRRGNPDRKS